MNLFIPLTYYNKTREINIQAGSSERSSTINVATYSKYMVFTYTVVWIDKATIYVSVVKFNDISAENIDRVISLNLYAMQNYCPAWITWRLWLVETRSMMRYNTNVAGMRDMANITQRAISNVTYPRSNSFYKKCNKQLWYIWRTLCCVYAISDYQQCT